MDASRLLTYFDSSPAIRLLRATSAPFVVAFLVQRFKESRAITIPHSELLPALAAFQEETRESYPEALLELHMRAKLAQDVGTERVQRATRDVRRGGTEPVG